MKRLAESMLEKWKNKPSRKPLLLRGVRQCGKTYLLRDIFGASFPRCHYFDLERDRRAASVFAEGSLDPRRLLAELEFVADAPMDSSNDLIVLDEIQACPRALTSLKYFCDDLPGSFVCAAGSLVGVTTSEEPFPVGKVEFLDLNPMSFLEFLHAVGEHKVLEVVRDANCRGPLPDSAHRRLWELLGDYLVVGGMPEAVASFLDVGRHRPREAFLEARRVQEGLIQGYLADMAKYSGRENSMHIERVWRNLPAQLGREVDGNAPRYVFKGVLPGRRGYRGLEGPIGWLERARLVLRCSLVERAEPPLSGWTKPGRFKLYAHDVGILGALAGIRILDRGGFQDGFYKGWVAESLVAQEMICMGDRELYSWKRNTAEVEFLHVLDEGICPVEVKVGKSKNSKSAGVFASRYESPVVFKLGAWNYRKRGRTCFLPLYAAVFLRALDSVSLL